MTTEYKEKVIIEGIKVGENKFYEFDVIVQNVTEKQKTQSLVLTPLLFKDMKDFDALNEDMVAKLNFLCRKGYIKANNIANQDFVYIDNVPANIAMKIFTLWVSSFLVELDSELVQIKA